MASSCGLADDFLRCGRLSSSMLPHYSSPVSTMAKEKTDVELKRLRTESKKTREDEVFGGLSPTERAEYKLTEARIHELESEILERAVAQSSGSATETEARKRKSAPV